MRKEENGVVRYISQLVFRDQDGIAHTIEGVQCLQDIGAETIVKTCVVVSCIGRGSIGDLAWTGQGIHIEEDSDFTMSGCYHDVLCIRVEKDVSIDGSIWTYRFLKY